MNQSDIEIAGNTKKNLATPFYVNLHSVNDHEHCCFFYICRTLNAEKLKTNHEIKNFGWFSKEDLGKNHVPKDVGLIGLKAFGLYENQNKDF